ncbi:MAG TPA: DUF192 domain-containing protein [Firmicutes bacterium]|mgnify:CR=1 FL=1|nr:DUF192 domain-containing protein [Bacillota bacterium]
MACSFLSRLVGFIGKKPQKGDALLIIPCKQIHTFFMQAPIDVVYLSKDGFVVDFFPSVLPGKILPYSRKTEMVLELALGTITYLAKGQKITFQLKE